MKHITPVSISLALSLSVLLNLLSLVLAGIALKSSFQMFYCRS